MCPESRLCCWLAAEDAQTDRASIRSHWQLRSLIGVGKQGTVYFPTGSRNLHIQKLDTETRETETIKILPFSPRCLVARNGWVCAGGETGEFVAMKVGDGDEGDANDLGVRLDFDADALLPLDLDSTHRDEAVLSLLSRSRPNKSLFAKSKSFGRERVNCITLWFPSSLAVQPVAGAYALPVAVLANNDKHVMIVSLDDPTLQDELAFPDCVNRAVISPDGRLLVAISDDPYLYVYARAEKSCGTTGSFRDADRPEYEWVKLTKVHLQGQRREDMSNSRGSFATFFSSDGRYLAVGTQYGLISVFNTEAFFDPSVDLLVTCFHSSQSNTDAGAVRDMAFSPGPFDLLAWSEDRGHIGVADLRSGFVSRQILDLRKLEDYEHISVTDRSTIDPRLLNNRGERNDRNDNLASSLDSTLDLSSESRRNPSRRPEIERYQTPFDPDDTEVLEALQEYRRRRDQRADRPTGQNHRPPWTQRSPGRSPLDNETSHSRERSTSVNRALSDILGNIRDQRERLHTTQERLRAQVRDAQRAAVPPPPRRAAARRAADPEASDNTERDDSSTVRQMLNLRQIARGAQPPTGGWADLETLYNISAEGGGVSDSPRLTDADTTRRDRAAFFGTLFSRDWEGRRHAEIYADASSPSPDETAGLAWSEDGQIL